MPRNRRFATKTHVARILAEPGLRDRVQAVVVVADSTGLVSPMTPEQEPG